MKTEEFIQYSEDLASAYVCYEDIKAIAASEERDEEDVRLDFEQYLGCDGYDFVEMEYDGRMIFHKENKE